MLTFYHYLSKSEKNHLIFISVGQRLKTVETTALIDWSTSSLQLHPEALHNDRFFKGGILLLISNVSAF